MMLPKQLASRLTKPEPSRLGVWDCRGHRRQTPGSGPLKAARELQKAFLAGEEVEKLLVNLEELKSDGSVTDEQYGYLKKDYEERLSAAGSAVAQQRTEIKRRLEDCRTSMANSRLESDRLGVRFKVGELPLDKYERADRRLRKRIGNTEAEIAELERILGANSASDVGMLPAKSGKLSPGAQRLSIPEASSFTAFVSSVGEVASPRTRLLGLVGGLFLFISVFMPWGTAGGFGYSISYPAADLSGHLTAAGVILGLVAIGAAFLAESQTKGFMHVVAGAIALLVLLIAMTVPHRELGTSIVGAMSRGWIGMGAGVVFYIIAAIAIIGGGVSENREG